MFGNCAILHLLSMILPCDLLCVRGIVYWGCGYVECGVAIQIRSAVGVLLLRSCFTAFSSWNFAYNVSIILFPPFVQSLIIASSYPKYPLQTTSAYQGLRLLLSSP